jgi:hypothetical protein
MSEYTCKCCDKAETGDKLPYQWASIHEEAAGVHDSACVTEKDDYFLCPECRWQAMKETINLLRR